MSKMLGIAAALVLALGAHAQTADPYQLVGFTDSPIFKGDTGVLGFTAACQAAFGPRRGCVRASRYSKRWSFRSPPWVTREGGYVPSCGRLGLARGGLVKYSWPMQAVWSHPRETSAATGGEMRSLVPVLRVSLLTTKAGSKR